MSPPSQPHPPHESVISSPCASRWLGPDLCQRSVQGGSIQSLTHFPFSSSVQHECIPQAILGMDVLCQAKSGMGKTAVFVLATLQQIEPINGQVGLWVPFWAGVPCVQLWVS